MFKADDLGVLRMRTSELDGIGQNNGCFTVVFTSAWDATPDYLTVAPNGHKTNAPASGYLLRKAPRNNPPASGVSDQTAEAAFEALFLNVG